MGEISDLLLNKQSGDVDRAIISFGGFLGIGEKKVAIPWNEIQVDQANNQVQVSMTEDQIKSAPTFQYSDSEKAVIGPKGRR